MAVSSYSSVSFNPLVNFQKVLQSGNIHSYLTNRDNSQLSKINVLAYRYLCFHLYAQHNIFNIRRYLNLSPDALASMNKYITDRKETFIEGASLVSIEFGGVIYKFVICKVSSTESPQFKAYVIVSNMTHDMLGGHKKLEYCCDISNGDLFVFSSKGSDSIHEKEIAIMRQFKDRPRISPFHILQFQDKSFGFLSPFCNAGDLCQFIQARTKLPTDLQRKWSTFFSLELCREVALSVAQLHNVRMAHCDLKPENVLLNFRGVKLEVKLTDFGEAAPFGEESGDGTMLYLPPEAHNSLLQGIKPLASSDLDIYGLGLIFFIISVQAGPPFMRERRLDKISSEISNLYANLEKQIYKTVANPYGLTKGSFIGTLVKDMICPPRMSIIEVLERIRAAIL